MSKQDLKDALYCINNHPHKYMLILYVSGGYRHDVHISLPTCYKRLFSDQKTAYSMGSKMLIADCGFHAFEVRGVQ